MKILVIFTGGTIGTSIKNGYAGIDSSTKYVLLNNYEYNKDELEFITSSPYSVLSENMSAVQLNLLQAEIAKNLTKDFDGIIVTHGTDTLQYTASAVEYAFNGSPIPIVFVSADYPLEDERTNGHANFKAAVEFIKSKVQNGVFVSYKNNDQNITNIHIASRILQHREYDANVYSIDGIPFAVYDGKITVNKVNFIQHTNNIGVVNYVDNPCILSIESSPGNNYSYCLDNVNAVMLKPYHSGTLDTTNNCFQDFCKYALKKNVPVFVTNTNPAVCYESTKVYNELGIKTLPFSTYISAYMKIWVAVSLKRDVSEFVNTQIANEMII